jgi:hypothetical protein
MADGRLPLVFPTKLPMPVGTSPFKIKGSVYAGLLSRYEKLVPGGLERVLQEIDDPETREFFSQKFLPNHWYDYLPNLLVDRAAIAASGRPAEEFLNEAATLHVESDLGGIYQALLFFSSPEAAMRRLPLINKQYFNFGHTEVQIVGKGVAETCISGWPDIIAPFYQLTASTFVHRLIELSGGKNPQGKWAEPEIDGEKAGIKTFRLRARTTWDQ